MSSDPEPQLITYNININSIGFDVISADLSVYLGPLATVETVIIENNGCPKRVYQITAPRKLSYMERADLEKDTERWKRQYVKILVGKVEGGML